MTPKKIACFVEGQTELDFCGKVISGNCGIQKDIY
jgi:hypothetical protein